MKITGRAPRGRVTIGPNLDLRHLRATSTSVDDLLSHLMLLMMGNPPGPGGSFNLGFSREKNALIRAARHTVTTITNQVSIFTCSNFDLSSILILFSAILHSFLYLNDF